VNLINGKFYRLLLAFLAVCSVVLILISPLGLERFATIKRVNWAQLSDIGQTYGAVSALIAGIALAGVAISLFLQAHTFTLSRIQATRTFHFDLIKYTIENPHIMPSWGFAPEPGSTMEDIQRLAFVGILTGFWVMCYEVGTINADELRNNFAELFSGEAGRNWWKTTWDGRSNTTGSRRLRNAVRIMREEFKKAEDKGPPVVAATQFIKAEQRSVAMQRMLQPKHAAGIVLAFGAGIAAANAVFRNRRSSIHR
jgi:hypothetical protein